MFVCEGFWGWVRGFDCVWVCLVLGVFVCVYVGLGSFFAWCCWFSFGGALVVLGFFWLFREF